MKKKNGMEKEKGAKRKGENKNREKKLRLPYGFLGKAVLGVVGFTGVLMLALAAPKAFEIIKLFEKRRGDDFRRYRSPVYLRKEIEKLRRKKMIIVFERRGETVMKLTEKGRRELLRYQFKERRLEKRHWDKNWRIVIFDIEEDKHGIRDGIREEMRSFGFEKLQASVWVYPYECEAVVALLKTEYGLGKELVYIVAGDIENDEWLRKKFHLN